MTAVLLTIHVLIVLALIGVVLLQRSDGGALGLGGGGGGGGGFMTGRGAANALTRTTSVLTVLFFATSISLAILAGRGETEETVIEELTGQAAPVGDISRPGAATTGDLLNSLGADDDETETPAAQSEPAGDETPADVLDTLGAENAGASEQTPSGAEDEDQPSEDTPQR